MNFVIWAPDIYTPNGGGCIALHKLCHNINSLGETCYIMTDSTNPLWKEIMVSMDEARQLCDNGAMAIYPEVTCGNPFNAKKVMRWVLYNVRKNGEFGIWGENDLIYKYAPHFTTRFNEIAHGELRAVELHLDILIDRKQPRLGSCYLIKKESNKQIIHPDNSIMLDNYPAKGGIKYLANVFNKCETFYSYDTATWLSIMASLCGCQSIVVPNSGTTAKEWHNGFPYFKYGIAYGFDDIKYANDTRHLLRPELLKIEAETIIETQNFINHAKSL